MESNDQQEREAGSRRETSQDSPQQARDWQAMIEERIKSLDLDNLDLSGKGKPLDLSTNPYANPATESAHRLLKDAGYTLPWIENSRQIDARLETARGRLLLAWQRHVALRDQQICAGHQWVEGEWEAALREFREEIQEVNLQIRDHNLEVPIFTLQKFTVRVDDELARLGIDG